MTDHNGLSDMLNDLLPIKEEAVQAQGASLQYVLREHPRTTLYTGSMDFRMTKGRMVTCSCPKQPTSFRTVHSKQG